MNSLSSVEAKLPPGFRFHPRDEELICDYLMKWVMGCAANAVAHPLSPSLIEVDLNKCEPWDIPETARVGGKDWYFYSQRDRKYATGLRTNRATISGYWKATGKDRPIIRKRNLVGMRKTLVFYQGRAPKGKKSDWVMHEYRLEGTYGPGPKSFSPVKEDWVLCRVFFKNMSQVRSKFQEAGDAYEAALSSSPLMEPYNNYANITFDDHTRPGPGDLYNEQVPCFSIFSINQTSPNFSLLDHMGPPEIMPNIISMPNSGGGGHFGASHNSPSLISNGPVSSSSSSCDEKVIKAVLSRLPKMESANDSPSFGEGSTESYLSHEVELCSIWNEYS